MSGGSNDRRMWESAVGSVFGAALSIMGILAAVMGLLVAQRQQVSAFDVATRPIDNLLAGAVVCFAVCGWCALFSALFLNGRIVRSVILHRRLIFWPMYLMLLGIVVGVVVVFLPNINKALTG